MGALHYLVVRLVIGNLLFLITSIIVIPLISDTNINLVNSKDIFYWIDFINYDIYNLYQSFFDNGINLKIFIGVLFIINCSYLFYTIVMFKYINMPHALNLMTNHKMFDSDNRTKVVKDFLYKIEKDKIIYKNWQAIDIDIYRENIERIRQYLGISSTVDIEVEVYNQKCIALKLIQIPEVIRRNIKTVFRKEQFYWGETKDGSYYTAFTDLIHMAVIGITKSGKTNFLKNIIEINFLKNREFIKELVLVDLKAGISFKKYKNEDKVCFIYTFNNLLEKLRVLHQNMMDRYTYMNDKDIEKIEGDYIFILIDEFSLISNMATKVQKEEIFQLIKSFSMLGRQANYLVIVTSQHATEEFIPKSVLMNLPYKVLFNTSSSHSINAMISNIDDIRDTVTTTHPRFFNKGRFLLNTDSTDGIKLCQALLLD